MTSNRPSWEPKRWSDGASDAPEALRPALQDARVEHVGADRVARLAERFSVGGVAAVGSSNISALGAVGAGSAGVAYKLWAALSGVVAVSALTLVIWNGVSSTDPLDARHSSPPSVSRAEQTTSVTATAVSELVQAVPAAMPTAASAVDDVAPGDVAPGAARPAARGAARRRTTSTDEPAVAAVGKLDAAAELAILNQAQDALSQAPRRALTLAGDHERAYPRGVFAQEREVIAIEALIKLQRSDEATKRGREFLSTFPSSTHAPRVQNMLGE